MTSCIVSRCRVPDFFIEFYLCSDSPVSFGGEMSRAVAAANYGFEQQLSPTILNSCEPQVPIHSMSPERVQVAMANGLEMENSPGTSSEGDSRGCESH